MKKLLLSIMGVTAFGAVLNAQVIFNVKTPVNLAGNYPLTVATTGWGTPDMNDPANAIEEKLVFVGPDSLACTDPENGAELAGHIAVLYRGGCEFGAKALRAQNAGAIGVIVINNQGAPVAMGSGASGAEVTIPTIMISTSDGALLRNEILAGNVTAFIGSKVGIYANDLGFKEREVIYPNSASHPITLAKTAGKYEVSPGLWVYNFGNEQQNATVNVTITRVGGAVVYNETSSSMAIASGDSGFVEFPVYAPAWTQDFEYILKYTISSGSEDEYPSDNSKEAKFTISNTTYAAAPVALATGLTESNNYIRSTTAPARHCIHFRDANASQLKFTGFSFALTPNTGGTLIDEYIELELYEWKDNFQDINDAVFNDIQPIAYGEYTYVENLANQTVFAPSTDNIVLKDNQRYLACLKQGNTNYFIGFYNGRDYNATIDKYLQPVSVVESGGTWYSAGFGTNNSAGIGMHTEPLNVGIDKNAVENLEPAFPMPATNFVNIPFNSSKSVSSVEIFDLSGKKIAATNGEITGSMLKVNTQNVINGQYVFNVLFTDGSNSSFKVMIRK